MSAYQTLHFMNASINSIHFFQKTFQFLHNLFYRNRRRIVIVCARRTLIFSSSGWRDCCGCVRNSAVINIHFDSIYLMKLWRAFIATGLVFPVKCYLRWRFNLFSSSRSRVRGWNGLCVICSWFRSGVFRSGRSCCRGTFTTTSAIVISTTAWWSRWCRCIGFFRWRRSCCSRSRLIMV